MVSAEVIRDTYIPCTLYVLFNISPDGLPLAGEREAIFFRSKKEEERIASERRHFINAG